MDGKSKTEMESLAEDYHRALSYLGFSHYNLKNEYDKGEQWFRDRLTTHLHDLGDKIPATVSVQSLTQMCIKYFRANF